MKLFAAMLIAAVAALVLSAPARAATNGVPVLLYHQVTDDKPPGLTVVPRAKFAQQMQYLASQQYRTLSIDELVAIMRGQQPMPAKAVVLTFDDGWRNVLNAIPILDQYNFKASFWIITHRGIGGQYLDWSDIRKLSHNPRYSFQSHSATHPWNPFSNMMTWAEGKTPGKSMANVRAELTESKRVLEAQIGRPVHYFAWPLGLYNEDMVQVAKDSGYKAVLTSDPGPGNAVGGDVFRIKRMAVRGTCDLGAFINQVTTFVENDC